MTTPEHAVRPVVLFDLDGVLTARDTFATLVIRRLTSAPWRMLLAFPALPVLAVSRYRPELRGRASRYLVRVALLGDSLHSAREECRALGEEFAATPAWLLRDGLDRARHHLQLGHRVIVVTATEVTLARCLLDATGLAGVEVIGSELSVARRGLRFHPHNYGGRKAESLEARGIARPWAAMYSDSLADWPLLGAVEQAYLVNATPGLRQRTPREVAIQCLEWA